MSSRSGLSTTLTPTLLLTSALIAATAGAAPRYQKPTRAAIEALPAKPGGAAKPRPAEPARPTLLVEQLRERVTVRVEDLTDAALRTLERLIALTTDSDPEKPDLLFRRAEHLRERKTQLMFKARALDEPIHRARGAERARLLAAQRAHEAGERGWLLRAAEASCPTR